MLDGNAGPPLPAVSDGQEGSLPLIRPSKGVRATAAKPTDEDAARRILAMVTGHFHRRAGGLLSAGQCAAALENQRFSREDFERGLRFAVRNGWLVERKDGLELTEAGFARQGGMAHTDEKAARRILRLFVHHFHRRAGEALSDSDFPGSFPNGTFHHDHFEGGARFAVRKGWLAEKESGWQLTEAGFAAAGGSPGRAGESRPSPASLELQEN